MQLEFVSFIAPIFLFLTVSIARAQAPIKVGQTVPITGPAAPNGNAIQQGTIAGFKHFNNRGGIDGHKIELISLDDFYEPEKMVKAYEKLIQTENVIGIDMPYGGANIEAVEARIQKEKGPYFHPSQHIISRARFAGIFFPIELIPATRSHL
jgi:ABC-type branched-subunit amino acid transport system substrate-binding protein